MSTGIRYSSTTLACPSPGALASFYATITGGEVTFVHDDEWATMRCEGARLEFMGVSGYQAPRWPEDSALVHIDFFVDDLETAAARVVAAGARRYEHQPNAAHCLVFADPAGHPFCLSLIDEVG
ncbi:VOC family protein [Georgenia faecalis]|uniref:VOC family protein n=1 Tax=Georgenia faecalis TaxID=2483799 RepID=UPI000FD76B92|nr:VOC family protein [Georgenia faecalis]